jgi:hypothetical protein
VWIGAASAVAAPSAEALSAPVPATLAVVRAPRPDTTGGRLEMDPACVGLPVRSIRVRPRNIYDPVPPGRLGPLYRAANHLHVVSRPATVREHLTFGADEPWSAEQGRETLRALRGLSFLDPVVLSATRRSDSVDVLVETRDVWSTITEFNIERGGGQSFGSLAFTERNLLGFGKYVSLNFRRDPAGDSRSIGWLDPALMGSRARLQFVTSSGTAGFTDFAFLGVPWWAQDAPYTAYVSWQRLEAPGRLFLSGGATGAEFLQQRKELEVAFGRGGLTDGIVRRVTWAFFARDRELGASTLQPGAPPEFAGEEEDLKVRRVSGELRVWKPRYLERRGIDRMVGIEDVDVGPAVGVKLGYAPRLFGSTTDEAYMRFTLDGGADTPAGFGTVHAALATRFRYKAEEMLRSVDARWASPWAPGQTLVGAAMGVWGLRMDRDWQAVIGGLNGLRAFPVHQVVGRQAWRFNLEERWLIGRDYLDLVNLGMAAFWDAGRAWGSGAAGTTWCQDAGIGLRVALPHMSSNQVLRFDIAWPVRPAPVGRREAVFSFGSHQAF